MAKLSSDGKYVTTESGDTLSEIAEKYGNGLSAQQLADINGIPDPNSIGVGQKIMLSKTVSYFAKYTGSSSSIVDALKSLGEKSTYSYRCTIATLNNISSYRGTAAQNSKMLSLLKQGKLIKAGTASATSSSSATVTYAADKVTLNTPRLLASSNNEVYVSWDWSDSKQKETAKYEVTWEYYTKDGLWFTGSSSDKTVDQSYLAESRYGTYKFPTNATRVRVRVKPVSKEKSNKDNKPTYYYDGKWCAWQYYEDDNLLPGTPSPPSVDVEKYKLTARLDNLKLDELNADQISFQLVKNDSEPVITDKAKIDTTYNYVKWSYDVEAGHEYKVRCKAFRGNLESDWSDFSAAVRAMPSVPSDLKCKASEKNNDGFSVYLEWKKVASADTYDIQYTTDKTYFDSIGGSVTDASTTDATTQITVYKLGSGEYWFRVRAKNEKGTSDWSELSSVKLGDPPEAPTTWESTTTAVTGEPLNLYWIHNSEDAASQTYAWLKLSVNGVEETHEIKNDAVYGIDANGFKYKVRDFEDDSEKDLTSMCVIDTNRFGEGAKLKWQVCTAGITNILGKWSTPRDIDIYAPATLSLMVTDSYNILEDGSIELVKPEGGVMSILGGFPFYVKAVAGPETQTPVGYHLSVSANNVYETVDSVGNVKMVSIGEQVYSKNFDISTPLMVEFSADNLDLENGIEYMITCTVSMNSGLKATATSTFMVEWTEMHYSPNAEIIIDNDTFSASIRPYCEELYSSHRKVDKESGVYSVTAEELDPLILENVYTATGERVYLGINSSGNEIYYCAVYTNASGSPIDPIYYRVTYDSGVYTRTSTRVNRSTIKHVYTSSGEEVQLGITGEGVGIYYCLKETFVLVEDVTLAVYRREFDGSFTEIAKDLVNGNNTFVTDPHPSLDYARYRIVAKENSTGAISYYDLPGHLVGGKSIIIQWDEAWSSFDTWSEDTMSQPTWAGSMLKLHYNIDVSDSNSSDVTQVKYIGRKRPVIYYGTQLGETATWNAAIEKDDEEAIYQLRRLQLWMGDVYVREPSGTGYWAHIKVSFSQKHKDLTVPVTLDVTRVEGGI